MKCENCKHFSQAGTKTYCAINRVYGIDGGYDRIIHKCGSYEFDNGGWISVEDELPSSEIHEGVDYHPRVMVYRVIDSNMNMNKQEIATHLFEDPHLWETDSKQVIDDVTHWQPLSPAPEEKLK